MQLSSDIAAIVTGSASGLGEATARRLAGTGVRVAVFDLNKERGQMVADEIGGCFCECDVSNPDSITEALVKARGAHGTERILVNCAGIAIGEKTVSRDRKTGEAKHHDLGHFARVLQINLQGTFNMIALSTVAMMDLDPITRDGGRGVVVNTASVAATDGQVGQVAYSASKGGVMAIALPIARDLAREGIRVNTILPGLFITPMFDGLPDEARDSLAAQVPFPSRLGDPDEYAQLVQQICENDMLNGESIRLDGAIRLAPR